MDDPYKIISQLETELAESFYETINLLGSVTTFTEKFYDGSHSRFVSEVSEQIAETMRMPAGDVMEIKIAGLLHDIGKIGFNDTVLAKFPAEMNPREYKKYTTHPELGRNLLKMHSSYKSVAEVVYQHHEKLDGSGFPNHLTSELIHPGAKIVAVVDIYHNAVFKRKKSRTADQSAVNFTSPAAYLQSTKDRYASVMNYLNKKAGVLFDKQVVGILSDIVERDRRAIGKKDVMRVPVNRLEPDMIFADNYYTEYGMLIAAKGEKITAEMLKTLLRFVENGELPPRILVVK